MRRAAALLLALLAAPAAAEWQAQEGPSPLTGGPVRNVLTPSDAPAACALPGQAPPRLVIQCREGVTRALVEHGCYAPGEGRPGAMFVRATAALDGALPDLPALEPSTDAGAFGYFGPPDAIPFVQRLFGAETFAVRFIDGFGTVSTLRFNVRGLEEAVGPLRTLCGW